MTLSSQLQELVEISNTKFPPQALAAIKTGQEELEALDLQKTARGVGDFLADATLLDVNGEPVSLLELNSEGPLIISFYRGGWCPYCNLELKAYQDILDQIKDAGGQLVAITPEKPDNALTTQEKNALAFPVLTDVGNQLAKDMGIAFEMPTAIQGLLKSFGADLPEINAETGWSMPAPATFVVDANGKIVLADIDVNYTRRLEPSDALAALKACSCSGSSDKQ